MVVFAFDTICLLEGKGAANTNTNLRPRISTQAKPTWLAQISVAHHSNRAHLHNLVFRELFERRRAQHRIDRARRSLRHTEDFFEELDAVAARISSTAAEDISSSLFQVGKQAQYDSITPCYYWRIARARTQTRTYPKMTLW